MKTAAFGAIVIEKAALRLLDVGHQILLFIVSVWVGRVSFLERYRTNFIRRDTTTSEPLRVTWEDLRGVCIKPGEALR